MPKTLKDLLGAANASVEKIDHGAARALIDEGGLLLDVRDVVELEKTGRAQGSHHIPRGMLEFRADPDSPMHDPQMQPERPVVIYCGSGARAALSGKLLQEMGYGRVYNAGSFKDWKEAGGAVDEPVDPGM